MGRCCCTNVGSCTVQDTLSNIMPSIVSTASWRSNRSGSPSFSQGNSRATLLVENAECDEGRPCDALAFARISGLIAEQKVLCQSIFLQMHLLCKTAEACLTDGMLTMDKINQFPKTSVFHILAGTLRYFNSSASAISRRSPEPSRLCSLTARVQTFLRQ